MNVYTYGNDGRVEYCREYLLGKNICSAKNIVLFPIPTSKDMETLNGTEESFASVCEKLVPSTVAVGYEIPKKFRTLLSEKNIIQIDVSRDEEYLKENASLTAVGTIGRILCEEKKAPQDLKIGVIGYGRIGKELVSRLIFLGAAVTVVTSRGELCYSMCEVGVSCICSSALCEEENLLKLSKLDILINTAPVKLIDESAALKLSSLRIIELASADNFPPCLYVERFASVPAAMYPKSAGIVLGRSILRMLGEEADSIAGEEGKI